MASGDLPFDLHWHAWTNVETEPRGRRSFAHVSRYAEPRTKADRPQRELVEASFERYWGRAARHTGFELEGASAGLKVFVGLHRVGAIWAKLNLRPWQGVLGRLDDMVIIGLRAHSGAVWWEIGQPRWGGHRGVPRWRSGNFNPLDALLGRADYDVTTVWGPTPVTVPLPEGNYLVELELRRFDRRRRRWPLRRSHYGYDMTKVLSEPGYIPSPGNPESDFYDGGDGTFGEAGGLWVPKGSSPSPHEAVGRIVASALADRRRRGVAPDYHERIGQ